MSTHLRDMPRGVWALGIVSLFSDLSSEMIHALLPIYLVGVLGASMLTVGLIEGIAEATVLITKIFSGAVSDRVGRRKPLAVLGYGLAALVKPVFPLASNVGWIFAARFADRIGKGIRGAPRDALVADLTPQAMRGAAFGLRQSLDTVGAVAGPLAAMALMVLLANDFAAVFWVATIPAFVAVAVLVLGVDEPARATQAVGRGAGPRAGAIGRLGGAFWAVVAVGAVLTLARFSEAFLILRAQSVGMSPAAAPAVIVAMSVAYMLSAYPAGLISDRLGRRGVLLAGIAALVASDLVLAAAGAVAGVMVGAALWGLHMGMTQGLLAALIADTAPAELRGTAFGLFGLTGGIAMLLASVIAGLLWDTAGPAATFLAGAAFTALAGLGLLVLARRADGDGGWHRA